MTVFACDLQMICVREKAHHPILPEGMAVAEVLNPQSGAPVCLVCEHSSGFIPPQFDDLGLSPEDRFSHAALDIGAEPLARHLSKSLGAPLILACISRLICDLNRPAASPEASPAKVERIEVPGNRGLSSADRMARARAIYHPFHRTVAKQMREHATPPALVTIHSFTPTWHGVPRETEIGFLHDADDKLATALLARADSRYRTDLNQPYAAKDGVTHTLQRHGAGRPNVMIEVRNDLLSDNEGIEQVGASLAASLTAVLAFEGRV